MSGWRSPTGWREGLYCEPVTTQSGDPLHSCRVGPQVLLPGAAAGPLAGLTFVAKDMLDVAGHATGAGNPTWLAEARPAEVSAPAVAKLVDAGATCLGKSHTDELAFSLSGRNAHYGTPRNSAAPGCTPGGSSSGTASAVAGGLVPFGLGTDTGGSIRVPASYCGLVGLRPTHGVISVDGVVPLAASFDTVGWLANSVDLAARVGEVLLAADTGPAPERLALVTAAQSAVSSTVRKAVTDAAHVLSRATGLPLATVDLPGGSLDTWLATFRTLQTFEANAAQGPWIAAHPGALSPDVKARFDSGATVTAEAFQQAKATRARLRLELLDLLADPPTVLVVASAAGAATPLDAAGPGLEEIRTATLRLTCIAGVSGAPGLSLPLAQLNTLPLGVGLIAAPGTDRSLLAFARAAGL